jgi:hypothetical protein
MWSITEVFRENDDSSGEPVLLALEIDLHPERANEDAKPPAR